MFKSYQKVITKKQAGVVYGAIKRGELHTELGYSPACVYQFADFHWNQGSKTEVEELQNEAAEHLRHAVDFFFEGDLKAAQLNLGLYCFCLKKIHPRKKY